MGWLMTSSSYRHLSDAFISAYEGSISAWFTYYYLAKRGLLFTHVCHASQVGSMRNQHVFCPLVFFFFFSPFLPLLLFIPLALLYLVSYNI